jgi:hypothetical protein
VKPEREKEIRERLRAFIHWHEKNPMGMYQDTHGPDMLELLEEIDRLRRELNQAIYEQEKIRAERDRAEDKLSMMRML